MNFPDGFNDAAFERIFGSRATGAELAKEAKQERVLKVIDDAFDRYKELGFIDLPDSWNTIALEIRKAVESPDDRELALAKDAFFEGDKEAMLQNVNAILGV